MLIKYLSAGYGHQSNMDNDDDDDDDDITYFKQEVGEDPDPGISKCGCVCAKNICSINREGASRGE